MSFGCTQAGRASTRTYENAEPGDSRAKRLWDLGQNQAVATGRIVQFLPGALQPLHRIPSDTLVCDLRFRFRCGKCNGREFKVTVEEVTSGRARCRPQRRRS